MTYVSFSYYILVIFVVGIYYVLPLRYRWLGLLAGSSCFYYMVIQRRMQIVIFASSIGISYASGLLVKYMKESGKQRKWSQLVLMAGIVLSVFPLLGSKCTDFYLGCIIHKPKISWIIPVGLSFYSLQIVAYLSDIYRGKICPQKNFLKYALFISFFPQIIQGPIPRYEQMERQLFQGNSFSSDGFMKGIQRIIWGFFLKFMIANKASVIVDAVFDHPDTYKGCFVLVAGVLYSFQLYADFQSCVSLSQGVTQLFGIELPDNFHQPYFSTTIKEFWRRWHISLSSWLRDYIYIPLGGSRAGRFRKYFNLVCTFAVSGIWHGSTWKYLLWGGVHSGYQIAGDITQNIQDRFFNQFQMPEGSKLRRLFQQLYIFCCVTVAWVIFRADSLKTGIRMLLSIIRYPNPWIFLDNSLFRLGLNQKEWEVLAVSLLLLLFVSMLHEKGVSVRDWFSRQHLGVRWGIYFCAICGIWVLGTYGFGFDANDFIYGGF